MPPSAAKIDAEVAAADGSVETRAAALINPVSGLASDYLNVFNELVMIIEQLPVMPDLVEDLIAWRPVSYRDYFEKSNLPGRAVALDHYETLAPGLRDDFEAAIADLDRCATGSVAAIRIQMRRKMTADPDALAQLCSRTCATLYGLLERITMLVDHGTAQAEESAQLRADRLLAVRIQALRDVKSFQDR